MDHYARLGLPRRLVLGEEELRAAYEERRRESHPDAGGEADAFREVQEAFAVLQRPGQRLRHWLELATGGFESRGEVPTEVMDVFGEVGGLLERLEDLRRKRAGAKSALAKSMAEREALQALAEVEASQRRVQAMQNEFGSRFAAFEEAGPDHCGAEAASVARGLAFLEKWEGQLREAGFSLVSGA